MPSHPLAFFGAVLMISSIMILLFGTVDGQATPVQLIFALSVVLCGCTLFLSGVLLSIAEGRQTRDHRIAEGGG